MIYIKGVLILRKKLSVTVKTSLSQFHLSDTSWLNLTTCWSSRPVISPLGKLGWAPSQSHASSFWVTATQHHTERSLFTLQCSSSQRLVRDHHLSGLPSPDLYFLGHCVPSLENQFCGSSPLESKAEKMFCKLSTSWEKSKNSKTTNLFFFFQLVCPEENNISNCLLTEWIRGWGERERVPLCAKHFTGRNKFRVT